MIISEKNKYIFIAIPKTGTTSIQSFLLENDQSCAWNSVNVGGKEVSITDHIKAKDLKGIMGEKYDDYTVFTFIRDPYARRVSSYFFYKNRNPMKMKSRYFIRNLMASINVFLTKMLPFSIWSVIKPQKKIVDYFYDDEGNLLIDLVGKTENLSNDLISICREIGIPIKEEKIPEKNKSKHSSIENYYTNSIHKNLYGKIIEEDIKIYQTYEETWYTDNYKSKVRGV